MTSPVHNPVPRIAPILKAVADFYEVDVRNLSAKGRTARVVLPRHVAMYLCRRLTRYSVKEIAEAFGGFDHSLVTYAEEQVQRRMTVDAAYRREVDHLFAQVGAGLQQLFPNTSVVRMGAAST